MPSGSTAARRSRLGHADVGALLAAPDWRDQAAAASGEQHPASSLDLAPVVPRPGKVVCVGLNYRNHILEMGRELPEYPTLFAKFADALIGPRDPIQLARRVRRRWTGKPSSRSSSAAPSAGPARPRPRRRSQASPCSTTSPCGTGSTAPRQWLQGKTFEATTPIGPVLVTPDELPGGVRPALSLTAAVDGETVQKADTSDLVFDPVALVRYVSDDHDAAAR